MRRCLFFCCVLLLGTNMSAVTWAEGKKGTPLPPIKLSISEPNRTQGGLLLASGWNLTYRLSASDWVGYYDDDQGISRYQALILDDPDNCLDLSAADPDNQPVDASCANPDETFVVFNRDSNDQAGVGNTGCPNLVDDALADIIAMNSFATANKVYLPSPGFLSPPGVGPYTGGDSAVPNSQDCFGYGADDDLPGLVVMINIGGAKFFDLNFDLQPNPKSSAFQRIKNAAGFLSNVSSEFINNQGKTAIVGHMWVQPGLLEPIAAYDADIAYPGASVAPPGVNVARRVDGGPIEYFQVPDAGGSPTSRYNASRALLPASYQVIVRAVLVEGPAPDVIEDRDGNGRFNANDVKLMGYTLLSNQAQKRLTLVQQDKLDDILATTKCPSARAIHQMDLDGQGPNSQCFGGDGTSRSIRRPPL